VFSQRKNSLSEQIHKLISFLKSNQFFIQIAILSYSVNHLHKLTSNPSYVLNRHERDSQKSASQKRDSIRFDQNNVSKLSTN